MIVKDHKKQKRVTCAPRPLIPATAVQVSPPVKYYRARANWKAKGGGVRAARAVYDFIITALICSHTFPPKGQD